MEHICFEVRLCIQKSILHEFCAIPGIWQIGCRAVSRLTSRNVFRQPECPSDSDGGHTVFKILAIRLAPWTKAGKHFTQQNHSLGELPSWSAE